MNTIKKYTFEIKKLHKKCPVMLPDLSFVIKSRVSTFTFDYLSDLPREDYELPKAI